MTTNTITRLLAGLALVSLADGQTIPNHAAANLALGQTGFTTNTAATTQSGLSDPSAVVVDAVSRKVFVADGNNNRVLRYASADSLANGATAEAVLGQPNFITNAIITPPTAQSMYAPGGLFLDSLGRLWVADDRNNRVLMFVNAVTITSNTAASRVYGQSSFTGNGSATTDVSMDNPVGVWVDASDRLWVGDSSNNRILRFDDITNKASGSPANGVLGQALFTTNGSASGAAGIYEAKGLAVSPSGALFVASPANNRVMRFDNAAALANGANASAVFGQPDFTTTTSGVTAVKMTSPRGLTVTSNDALWVCDTSNNRVIRFDQASTRSSGAAANGVVGKPNLTTSGFTSLDARGLSSPSHSPFVDSTGSLWVPDQSNRRVLRYAPLPNAVPDVTANVQYRVNDGPLITATGTTSWSFRSKLKKGKNTITVIATDNNDIASLKLVIKIKRK